ncbi:MAG: hypothetical protein CMQ17_08810 [Gammaproteobacteria bacterium]|nr:hypothetical protein [Gammaproteobacteria bacterium]
MFGFGKKQKSSIDSKENSTDKSSGLREEDVSDESGLFARLKQGLSLTRNSLSEGLNELILGEKIIDSELLDEIETQLLSADVGLGATDQVIANLKSSLSRKQLSNSADFLSKGRFQPRMNFLPHGLR